MYRRLSTVTHLMNKDRSGSGFCQEGSSSRENIQTNLSTEITTLVSRSVNTCFYHHATIIPTVKDKRINVQEPHIKMKQSRLKRQARSKTTRKERMERRRRCSGGGEVMSNLQPSLFSSGRYSNRRESVFLSCSPLTDVLEILNIDLGTWLETS